MAFISGCGIFTPVAVTPIPSIGCCLVSNAKDRAAAARAKAEKSRAAAIVANRIADEDEAAAIKAKDTAAAAAAKAVADKSRAAAIVANKIADQDEAAAIKAKKEADAEKDCLQKELANIICLQTLLTRPLLYPCFF